MNVRKTAELFEVPILEAMVAAGYLTPEEAQTPPAPPLASLSEVGTVALVDELRERCVKLEELMGRIGNAGTRGSIEIDVPRPGTPKESHRAK